MSHSIQSAYRGLPSWIERSVSVLGLIVLSPVLAVAAVAIIAEDGFPVLFRQTRVGRHGRLFQLLKFRSMRNGMHGTRITAGGDKRIGSVGRILRRYKLDEIPQLWNVAAGHMSLIGPRPEVPAFVDTTDPSWHEVLQAKPGITDLATLLYRNEEHLLRDASDPELVYRTDVLPAKLRLNLLYQGCRTVATDLRLIGLTVACSLRPALFDHDRLRRLILRDTNS